jgi:nitroreductase
LLGPHHPGHFLAPFDGDVCVGTVRTAAVGFIAENVYLYCASEGLAAAVCASIDKPALAKILNLQPPQEIILAQSVGYTKK